MAQVEILFCHPTWPNFWRGLYTHRPDEPIQERLMGYNQDKDRYFEIAEDLLELGLAAPTHYWLLPDRPKIKMDITSSSDHAPWVRFNEKKPTQFPEEPIEILFCNPFWATFMRGIYTDFEDDLIPLSKRLQEFDEFTGITSEFFDCGPLLNPIHYLLLPAMPG